jgi:hypothetical protein
VRITGGGIFGVVVKSGWKVAHQRQRGNTVTLTRRSLLLSSAHTGRTPSEQ